MAQRRLDRPGTAFPLEVVLGVNVRAERDERGWSQERLGVYAQTTRVTVSKIERWQSIEDEGTTLRMVGHLADAFEIDWRDLLHIYPERQERYAVATRVYLQGHPAAFEVIAGAGRTSPQQPPLMAAVSP